MARPWYKIASNEGESFAKATINCELNHNKQRGFTWMSALLTWAAQLFKTSLLLLYPVFYSSTALC